MQQSWTDKAEARLKKAQKDEAGDAYSRSDGRKKNESRRDRDRDAEGSRYDKDQRGSGDRDSRGNDTRRKESADKKDTGKDAPRKESPGKRDTGKRDRTGAPITPVGKRRQKGTMAIGPSNDRVDYTKKGFFKLGGGRYFEKAACVDVLVREYSFPREKAMKMGFECGLSDFDDCAMCPTPAKKGHSSKTDDYHSFPEDCWILCRKLVQ